MRFTLTKNLLLLIILGTVFAISLAINSIFTTIRDQYLHFHQQLLAGFVYLIILLVLLGVFVYLYGRLRGSPVNLEKLLT